jgi:hypothetical protein
MVPSFFMFLVLLIWLFISVMSGDVSLGRKGIVKSLTKGKGDQSAIFSFYTEGVNVLHVAASVGHLEVCKYLVEELGGDVNAPAYGALALGPSLSLYSFFKSVATMSAFPSLRPEIVFMMCIFFLQDRARS